MKKIFLSLIFLLFCFLLFAQNQKMNSTLWNNLFESDPRQMYESWKRLSQDERWFCLLSEPLIEMNSLSVATVNPERFIAKKSKSVSQTILENSWKIFSKDDVIQTAESFFAKKSGHGVIYEEIKAVLNKSPELSVEQLAIMDCMDSRAISTLYFVSEIKDVLGEYGMLAWDYGRVLSILRWSIAAGWLQEAEALNIAKPFIEVLINAYDSWEDYAVHYALGRVFFAFTEDCDCQYYLNEVMDCITKYDIVVAENEKIFTYHDTKFPGKKQNGNRILKYSDAVYKPSKDAASWNWFSKIEKNDKYEFNSSDNAAMNSFLKKNAKIPIVAGFMASLQTKKESEKLLKSLSAYNGKKATEADIKKIKKLYKNSYKKVQKFFDEATSAFDNVVNTNDTYFKFYIGYAFVSYMADDIQKMEFSMSKLDEGKCRDVLDYLCINCIYFTEKAKECVAVKNYVSGIEYATKAASYLIKGKQFRYWGIISPEFMKGYDNTLTEIHDECNRNLKLIDKYQHSA